MPKTYKARGFTLIELLVVLIIVGILTGLAIPGFTKTREKALDKEAQVSLNLIQAAEKMYYAKQGVYYTGATALNDINSNLQLDLVAGSWAYSIDVALADFIGKAIRSGGTREWRIMKDSPDPYCVAGCL